MNTTELEVLGLNSNDNTNLLPAATRVKAGKGFKSRINFGGGSASELRATFKASGLKGKKLDNAVRDALTGDKSMRDILAAAYVQRCIQLGKIASHAEETKGVSKLVFVNAPAIKTVEVQSTEPDYENMTVDEIAEAIHKLESLLDARGMSIIPDATEKDIMSTAGYQIS